MNQVTVSLTLAILVGLSVDYVVHLAEAYHHSPYTDRQSRTRHMLQALGPSVLSGAATTIGASFFMLFAKIQFLLQFASCLMATIGFSLFFSLALFTTVMAMVGPEGDTGSIVEFFRWLKRLLLGDRRKGEVYCPTCKGTGFVGDKCIAAADLNGSFYAEQENSMLKHADLQWTERPPADSSIAARIDRDPTAVDDGRGRSNTSPEEQQHRTDCSGCELYATEAPEESDVAEDRRGSHREVSIDIEKF